MKIHPTSDVQSKNIGYQTSVWQFVVILPKAIIGSNCNINSHVFIENDVVIGDNVTIKSGVQIWDGIRIGNDVFIGPNVTFTNDRIPRSKKYPDKFDVISIGEGASIGANATIIGPRNIGRYSFIGAGAVVTKDVEPFAVVVGNPARKTGYLTKDKILLDLDMIDRNRIKQYKIQNGELVLEND